MFPNEFVGLLCRPSTAEVPLESKNSSVQSAGSLRVEVAGGEATETRTKSI
jgi:hypothetical protein